MQHVRGFSGVDALHKFSFYLLIYLPDGHKLYMESHASNEYCYCGVWRKISLPL